MAEIISPDNGFMPFASNAVRAVSLTRMELAQRDYEEALLPDGLALDIFLEAKLYFSAAEVIDLDCIAGWMADQIIQRQIVPFRDRARVYV
jgi:hypothetical protein